mmetsp:Transcript_39678/g.112567  ORF Transcript_39678/g.112567 Transcript_39678/m.112567 type:complete len:219 (+) Transcript_39678:2238-2894(+)
MNDLGRLGGSKENTVWQEGMSSPSSATSVASSSRHSWLIYSASTCLVSVLDCLSRLPPPAPPMMHCGLRQARARMRERSPTSAAAVRRISTKHNIDCPGLVASAARMAATRVRTLSLTKWARPLLPLMAPSTASMLSDSTATSQASYRSSAALRGVSCRRAPAMRSVQWLLNMSGPSSVSTPSVMSARLSTRQRRTLRISEGGKAVWSSISFARANSL